MTQPPKTHHKLQLNDYLRERRALVGGLGFGARAPRNIVSYAKFT